MAQKCPKMTQNGPNMTPNDPKWLKMAQKLPKNDISEMSRFTRFARHKFSADRRLKLFCTPDDSCILQCFSRKDLSLGTSLQNCLQGMIVLDQEGTKLNVEVNILIIMSLNCYSIQKQENH